MDAAGYFRVLRLTPNATHTDIKRAFRILARQYHPDLNPNNPTAAAEFQQICQAYEILSHHIQEQHFGTPPHAKADPAAVILQDPQYYFTQGVRQASQQQYPGAISSFTQAILLEPQFLEAYMGRCQARHVMGDARGVLNDCEQILRLQPDTAQAYYFRGRASARLGYAEPAFEAYTHSIQLDQDYAQAYYHRGLVQVHTAPQRAAQDFKIASTLFRKQGNVSSAQRAEAKLTEINRQPLLFLMGLPTASWAILAAAVTTLPHLLINPTGSILSAFQRLSPSRVAGTGVVFVAIALCCWITALTQYWPQLLPLSVIELGSLGAVFWSSLVGTSWITRLVAGSQGNWTGDLFLAGSVVLLLGASVLLSGLLHQLGPIGLMVSGIFGGCSACLTLYSGYTKLNQLSDQSAGFAVPLAFMISSGLTLMMYQLISVS